MKLQSLPLFLSGIFAAGLPLSTARAADLPRRFFSDDSFWNQPIAPDVAIDPRTERWVKLLETDPEILPPSLKLVPFCCQ